MAQNFSQTYSVPELKPLYSTKENPSSLFVDRCSPSLARKCDIKVNFVDSLVDTSTQIVEAIWPQSSALYHREMGNRDVIPLQTFIRETLRRSKTSFSTLQVTLYYLILIKPHVPRYDSTMVDSKSPSNQALRLGRRMFLSALILASKYLQDRNYSARAWSKISGLSVLEINQNEITFLSAVNWELHVTDSMFQRWTEIVLRITSEFPPCSQATRFQYGEILSDWKSVILKLDPQLSNFDYLTSDAQEFATLNQLHIQTPSCVHPCLATLEPSPSSVCSDSRAAPALGLLPTSEASSFSVKCKTSMRDLGCCKLRFPLLGKTRFQTRNLAFYDRNLKFSARDIALPPDFYLRPEFSESVSHLNSSSSSLTESTFGMTKTITAPEITSNMQYCSSSRSSLRQTSSFTSDMSMNSELNPQIGYTNATTPDLSLSSPISIRENSSYFSKNEEATLGFQDLHSHPRSSDTQYQQIMRSVSPSSIRNIPQARSFNLLSEPCHLLLRKRRSSEYDHPLSKIQDNCSQDQLVGDLAAPVFSVARKRFCCSAEASLSNSYGGYHQYLGAIDSLGSRNGILN